ncbi:MAG: CAP domain-containing protein [Patescibacteria group bacterium]
MYAKTIILIIALASLLVRPAIASEISPQTIFELTNEVRAEHGLAPLTYSRSLEQAASVKTQDMVKQGYFDHVGPNGQTPWAIMEQAGYHYEFGGENLAVGFSSSQDMVQAWLNSPSHRQNLLEPNFEDIGIATLPALVDGLPDIIVVQMFGSLANNIESNGELTSYVNSLLGVGDGV